MDTGNEIADKTKKEFFIGMEDLGAIAQSSSKKRRIDVDKVVDATMQVLLSIENKGDFLDKKVKNGETDFNADEYEIAKTMTEERVAKDLAEGKVSKYICSVCLFFLVYILKLMDDPKVLTQWDQIKFDNFKRSEE